MTHQRRLLTEFFQIRPAKTRELYGFGLCRVGISSGYVKDTEGFLLCFIGGLIVMIKSAKPLDRIPDNFSGKDTRIFPGMSLGSFSLASNE